MKKLLLLAMLAVGLSACTEEKDCWKCGVTGYEQIGEYKVTVWQYYDCNFDAQTWGDRTFSNGKAERIRCNNQETGETLIWE